MKELKIVDGKFMRGGEVVPPIIGDPEQITLLKRIEAEKKRMDKEGIPCEFYAKNVDFDGHIDFECLCGNQINECISMDMPRVYDLESDIIDQWKDEEITCNKCHREYAVENGKAKLKTKRDEGNYE